MIACLSHTLTLTYVFLYSHADGTGYVEDGREIFDDEYDEGTGDGQSKASGSSRNKPSEPKSKKRLRDINAPVNDKSNIKRLFGNAAANKKSDSAPKLAEDDILSDILGEMDTADNVSAGGSTLRPNPISALRRSSKDGNSEKKRVSQFLQGFTANSAAAKSDDALIDEMMRKQKPKTPAATSSAVDVKPTAAELSKANRAALLKPKVEPASTTAKSGNADLDEMDPLAFDDPMPIPSSAASADDAADIDFSILDDDENQFEVATSSDKSSVNTATTAAHKPGKIEPAAAPAVADDTESYDKLLQHWENTCNMKDMADEFADAGADDAADFGDSSTPVRFWFWDAWEDPYKKPGQIYLFGKIAVEGKSPPEFKSACIKVENIERCLYLLPREFVSAFVM